MSALAAAAVVVAACSPPPLLPPLLTVPLGTRLAASMFLSPSSKADMLCFSANDAWDSRAPRGNRLQAARRRTVMSSKDGVGDVPEEEEDAAAAAPAAGSMAAAEAAAGAGATAAGAGAGADMTVVHSGDGAWRGGLLCSCRRKRSLATRISSQAERGHTSAAHSADDDTVQRRTPINAGSTHRPTRAPHAPANLWHHCSRPIPPQKMSSVASVVSVVSPPSSPSPLLRPTPPIVHVMRDIEEMMARDDDEGEGEGDSAPPQQPDESARLAALQSGSQRASALRGLSKPLSKILSIIEAAVTSETSGGSSKGKRRSKTPAPRPSAPPMRFDGFQSMEQLFAVSLSKGDAEDVEALQHGVLFRLGSESAGGSQTQKLLLHVETHPRVLAAPERFGLPLGEAPADPAEMPMSRHITKRKRNSRSKKLEQSQPQLPLAFLGLYLESQPGAGSKSSSQLIPVACNDLLEDGCVMLRTEAQAKKVLSSLLRALVQHEAKQKRVEEWALEYRIKGDEEDQQQEEDEAENQQLRVASIVQEAEPAPQKRARRTRTGGD